MLKLSVSVLTIGLSACTAMGADVVVGAHGVLNKEVPEGTETADGAVLADPAARLVKTGAGTWQVSDAQAEQPMPFALEAGEGTVAWTEGASRQPISREQVLSLLSAKAKFWVDASKADSFVASEKGGIERWCDVRETDPSAPTHVYAQAFLATNDTQRYSHARPERVVTNGLDAVYFGGMGANPSNGRAMIWHKPNGDTAIGPDISTAFVVHQVTDGQGVIFGSTNDTTHLSIGSVFWGTAAASFSYPIMRYETMTMALNGRQFLNGVRTDFMTQNPQRGLWLYEYESPVEFPFNASAFFVHDGGSEANSTKLGVKKGGGDYLMEAIVFTNRLTEAERVLVTAYLSRKWLPKSAAARTLTTAADGSVALSGAAVRAGLKGDGTFSAAPYQRVHPLAAVGPFEGKGEFKPGSGTAGQVILLKQMPLQAKAGQTLIAAASRTDGPNVYAENTAGAKEIVKDGSGVATIHGVPEGVESLTVRKGLLAVEPGPAADWSETVEVPIPNASFEERATAADADAWGHQWAANATYCGWKSTTASCFVYDFTKWDLDAKGANAATRNQWGLRAQPPDGNSAMLIQGTAVVTTDVEIPSAGSYVFSFALSNRSTSKGFPLLITFIEKATGNRVLVSKVPNFAEQNSTVFTARAFRFKLPSAGAYTLELKRDAYGPDVSVVLDDLRLRRVPAGDSFDDWSIPGGNFENVQWGPTNSCYASRSNVNTVAGWTLSAAKTGCEPIFTCRAIRKPESTSIGSIPYSYYNDSRAPFDNGQLWFGHRNAFAETTFTPPAGRWYLKADIAGGGQYIGSLMATLVNGDGMETSLGSLVPSTRTFETRRFPTPFTADGTTPVTVRLSFAPSGSAGDVPANSHTVKTDKIYVDNVVLSPRRTALEAELLKNSSFELNNSDWTVTSDDYYDATGKKVYTVGSSRVAYTSYPRQYSADVCDGLVMRTLRGRGAIAQSVELPAPGWYRFAYNVHHRTDFAANPIEAFAVIGGVTNRLVVSANHAYTNFVEHVGLFKVESAQTVTVGLRGTNDLTGMTKDDRDALVDGLSLKLTQPPAGLPFAENLTVRIEEGARLALNFAGTNTVERLRINGRTVTGVVSAATHPGLVYGVGALEARPHGAVVIVR